MKKWLFWSAQTCVAMMNGVYIYNMMRRPPAAPIWASLLSAVLTIILYGCVGYGGYLLGRHVESRR